LSITIEEARAIMQEKELEKRRELSERIAAAEREHFFWSWATSLGCYNHVIEEKRKDAARTLGTLLMMRHHLQNERNIGI
jgi:hypothetical protein